MRTRQRSHRGTQPVATLGDEEFDSMWRSDWPMLIRLAWLLLGDGTAAEDVVQDAFVSVYRRWPTLTDLPGARSYLRTAVLNAARSTLRRGALRSRLENRLAAAPADVSHPQDSYGDHAALSAALARLPRRQREVVVLRYWLGLSEAEIADTLGVSNGTVKSTAARALVKLRESLGDVSTNGF